MDEKITKAIDLIEQKIQSLLNEAKSREDEARSLQGVIARLREAFGSENGRGSEQPAQAYAQLPLPRNRQQPQTRKQQIMELIRSRGPLRRAEIIETGGVPRGTVAFVLNDKDTFRQLKDGRWDLVAQQGEEFVTEEKGGH